ncbi:DUF1642 domain-containing protein [Companilactobacillus alimentarius]|uniref:DUF1642 domain-containing protein n=1 Tax=Companilactobacillus alimentarius TaxID=1602 RepID=UPI0028B7CBF0|nr:DUF1642 domain-containing protein [Companilactobacillus alimentarius]MDT6951848.1 DUF1642 domain-containing protein [Companilactobacillus alimentarius]
MDNVRILKGYSKTERKELEDAKYNGFNNAIYLINGIADDDDDCTSLTEKYINGNPDEDNQLARDIADYYDGEAKFPEQKYYVQLIKNNDGSYLNRNRLDAFLTLDGCHSALNYQTEFTEQEIKDIDPRYMAFAVPVEDDNE